MHTDSVDRQIDIKQENCLKYESFADVLQADALCNPIQLTEMKQEKVEGESSSTDVESQQLRQEQHTLKDDPHVVNIEVEQPTAEDINIKTEIRDGFHVEKQGFKCPVCKYRCLSKARFTEHINSHPGVNPFACEMCLYKCSRKSSLRDHMRAHTGEKPFECSICKQTFPDSIARHMERVHAGPFQCLICNDKYSSKRRLRFHMKIHNGKLYECTSCKIKFTTRSQMNKHKKMHSGIKPYACTICKKKFLREGDLRQHMKIHAGVRSFECTICKAKFNTSSSRKQHFRTHTGGKPYECEMRAKKFATRIKRHHKKPCTLSVSVTKCNRNQGKMDSFFKKEVKTELEISSKLSVNSSENTSDKNSTLTDIKQERLSPELQLEAKDESAAMSIKSEQLCEELTFKEELEYNVESGTIL